MEILISVLIFLTISAIILAVSAFLNREKISIANRLSTYTASRDKHDLPPELQIPLSKRFGSWWSQMMNKISSRMVTGDKKTEYGEKVRKAGYPYGFNVESFLAFKYTVLIIAVLLGILTRNVGYFLIIVIIGYLLPDMLLNSKEKQRKDMILKGLPDVLDLLSVSVEAGLGFDAALQKVVEKTKGPLAAEFEQTLQEINIGKQRREALRDLAERVDVNDVTVFIGAVIQADQLGVSITNVLRLQSGQVRANRRMRAEEKAQQAPVKILIPLVLFVFPTILIVLLGPAIISIMDTL